MLREELIKDIVMRQSRPLVNERLYSIDEVATKLGCHRSTVYNKHIKNGLRTTSFGERHKKVKASDLVDYIRSATSQLKRLSFESLFKF